MMLTVLMVVMSCPLQAIAYYTPQVDQTVSTPSETEPLDLAEVEILSEDISKRGESQKHFKLSDGSFVAVQYSEPVHYSDEDGKWLDIDNSLIFDEADIGSVEDFDGYINTANSFKAKFADSVEDAMFYIEGSTGENKMSFEFIDNDANSVEANINNIAAATIDTEASLLSRNQEMIACNNVSAEIAYDEIIDDVDFNYTVTARGIKENIIINRRLDNYSFAFSVDADGLTLTKKSDGSIVATDTENNVIYTIPAPFMYDENGRFSDAVIYTLSEKANGKYTLTIVADKEWINSSETTFPVVIDPIVNTTDNIEENNPLIATYVTSAEADANKSNVPAMFVGKHTNGSINRAYIEMYIPTLSRNSVITSAQLCLYQVLQPSDTYMVELHEASDTWDKSTLTWNNQPGYEDTIIDCIDVSEGTNSSFKKWDITRQALEYDGVDSTNGFVLKASDETVSAYTQVLNGMAASALRPYIIVKYRSQMGIEDDFSYITYSDNNDGITYVNNYTGNLTYIYKVVASRSDIMPASLDLIYNSSIAYNHFSCSNVDRLNTCLYSDMHLSTGWKLSAQQSIVPISIMDVTLDNSENEYAYIYTDEDGTEHYFYRDTDNTESITYIDEDNLGLTITYDELNNQYKLESSDGYTKLFKIIQESGMNGTTANGYIISEVDSNGNSITYTYDTNLPTRLVSIRDASNTIIRLSYDDYGYLSAVTMGSTTVTLAYQRVVNNSQVPVLLNTISRNTDGNNTYFLYNYGTSVLNDGLSNVTNADGSGLAFTYQDIYYDSFLQGLKVEGVAWRTGEGGGICKALYDYQISNSTTIHNIGTDCIADTSDDLYYTYTFDKGGNTTLLYTENNTRDIVYSTSMYGYANSSTMNITDSKCKLSSYADVGVTGINLISDSSAEGDSLIMTSLNNATIAEVTTEQYIGLNSISASVDDETEGYGMRTYEYISEGKYTFSAYLKTGTNYTGELSLKVYDSNGELLSVSNSITSTNEKLNGGWYRLYVDFELVEAQTVSIDIVSTGSGIFYCDALQLEVYTGFTPSTYNMLENSCFENNLSSWDSSHLTQDISIANDGKFGSNAVNINGDISKDYTLLQTVEIGCIPENSYILSGWAKAYSLPATNRQKYFELIAIVSYKYINSDNNIITADLTTSIPFTWETSAWQYTSGIIQMPHNEIGKTIVEVTSIKVGVRYGNNSNSALFDNISLIESCSYNITYDSNNNISCIAQNNESNYTYLYDNNSNLCEVLDGDNNTYRKYEYDSDGNLLKTMDGNGDIIEEYSYIDGKLTSVNNDDYKIEYEYTDWGSLSSTQMVSFDSSNSVSTPVLSSQNMFDENTKLLTSRIDEFNNRTYYGYNSDFWITSIEDAYTNITRYSYTNSFLDYEYHDLNQDGELNDNEAIVDYEYDSYGKLIGISTRTTSYRFTYNEANLPQSIFIVGKEIPLLTYLYNNNYTSEVGVCYSNGLTIQHEYDNCGNIISTKHNETVVQEYRYDCNFNLTEYQDHKTNTNTEYYYDVGGQLYLTRVISNDHCLEYYSEYDEDSNETKSVMSLDGDNIVYSLEYDDNNNLESYILPNLSYITSDKDIFGKTKNVYLKDSDGDNLLAFEYEYTVFYAQPSENRSKFVSKVEYDNGTTYSYTYDKMGNVTSANIDEYSITYVYNSLYQLVRENNQLANKSWVYEYDSSGNILNKKEYLYTTSEVLGTINKTSVYSYDQETWGDLLISYNGQNIDYDSYGNPMNWINNEVLSWEGTSLQKFNNCTFNYNTEGQRIAKITDEYKVEYIYSGDTLVGEIKTISSGQYTSKMYYYDINGIPVAWELNGNIYYYIKDYQENITGFVDSMGNVVCTYSYDIFGNIVFMSGDNMLAMSNSLRYRGQYYDIETGLYHTKTGYYDPEVGRYLSINDSPNPHTIMSDYNLYDYNYFSLSSYYRGSSISNNLISPSIINPTDVVNSIPLVFQNNACSILYNVPLYAQYGNLCWAYCQIMAESYFENTYLDSDMAYEKAVALAKLVHRREDEEFWDRGSRPTNLGGTIDSFSSSKIFASLKKYGPLFVSYMYWTGPNKPTGHGILITGWDSYKGIVYTNNPWGISGSQPYDDFYDGFLGFWGVTIRKYSLESICYFSQ